MMTFTDGIALITLTALLINGAYQGILRSLITPLSLVLTTLSSWACYALTRDPRAGLICIILGPLLLGRLLHIGVEKITGPATPQRFSPLSSAGGVLINAAWGSALIAATITLLAVTPLDKLDLAAMGKDVRASRILAVMTPELIRRGILPDPALEKAQDCLGDACPLLALSATVDEDEEDVQRLLNDPRVRALMSDAVFQEAMTKKDMGTLLRNENVLALSQDPAFLADMLRVYPKLQRAAARRHVAMPDAPEIRP